MADDVREILLDTIEASLEAQLSAVRRLRKNQTPLKGVRKARSGRSQLSIVLDLLKEANRPLHITEIVEQAHKRFGQKLDRESLVSALSKRVARGDRFRRTAPNTFAALASEVDKEED
jgi:hypothetical protein